MTVYVKTKTKLVALSVRTAFQARRAAIMLRNCDMSKFK